MSRIFAHLRESTVIELLVERQDITKEWSAEFLKNCVDVTNANPAVKVGWVRSSNGVFSPPLPPVFTPGQQMNRAVISGCEITVTSKSALSGTYDAYGQRWSQMRQEAQYIVTFGAFSGALTELDWPVKGGDVIFSDMDDFKMIVRAISDWLTGWQRFVDGKEPTPPASPVTLP